VFMVAGAVAPGEPLPAVQQMITWDTVSR
jgi:hypothetical protein